MPVAGQQMLVLDAGPLDGPAVVLLHGLASDSGTWQPLIGPLTERGIRVIAPDLLGHGESGKPIDGYTLDGFSEHLSQLQQKLGLAPVTLVGHSFGGAVAMHFAHHYPAAVAGLVIVAAGGLGRGVHPILRAAAVPGAERVLGAVLNPRTSSILSQPALRRALRLSPEAVSNLTRIGRNLISHESRTAFFATLRHVIAPGGQRGSMIDMEYFQHQLPTMIVWSERDPVIPVSHAHLLHQHLADSRLELFPGTSHEPHRRYPERFADLVAEFVRSAQPAH